MPPQSLDGPNRHVAYQPHVICQPQFPIAMAMTARATRTPRSRPFFHCSISLPSLEDAFDPRDDEPRYGLRNHSMGGFHVHLVTSDVRVGYERCR